jgi:hypothetical protein
MKNSDGQIAESDDIFQVIINWMYEERAYQHEKFSMEENDESTPAEGAVAAGSYWMQQFNSYLQRLDLLPLDTPQGKQAAAKFTATALGFLESIMRRHGDLPRPGVPSGVLEEWTA